VTVGKPHVNHRTKEARIVRRAMTRGGVVGAALLAGVVGLALPAGAAITAPGSGATLSGNVSLADNGTSSGGEIVTVFGVTITTCNGSTNMFVDSGAGTTVGSTTVVNLGTVASDAGSNPQSGTWNTSLVPNGAYTVDATEVKKTSSCLSTTTNTVHEPVTVTNTGQLAYGGVTSAAQGTSINVSATLTDLANVAPNVGQTVSFAFAGHPAVNATTNTSTGQATATLVVPQGPGATTLQVSYGGGFYTAVTDNVGFSITKDPTTTTVTPPSATAFGQPTQFTASVASQVAGEPVPTGTVNFLVDGTSIGTTNLVNGSATSPPDSALAVGSHSVVAQYSGDGNFLTSSGSSAQTVNQAVTVVTLQSTVSESKFGQSVSYTAQVTTQAPGAGVPTGTVSFSETPAGGSPQPIGGAKPLSPTGNANQSGAQSDAIAVLAAGSYTITATYSGGTGSNFAASSGDITQVVDPAGTMVTLQSSSPTFAVFGQPVSYTATVNALAPGAGIPTGTVSFKANGTTDLGTIGLNNSGQATSNSISTLNPAQPNSITATYTNADGNFVTGTMATFQQLVLPDPTTTVITTSPQQSVFGQPVNLIATVSADPPGAGVPTGSVEFTINGTDVGTPVNLNGSGVATLNGIANLQPGTYAISAVYSNADGDFAGSANPDSSLVSATLTVSEDPTTTGVVSSTNPTVFGQSTTFTATVSANAPGAGIPSGTVEFEDGSTIIGIGSLNQVAGDDQATFSTSALAVGSHAISAVYEGDSDFLTSTGTLNQTVNQDPSVTTVTQNGQSVQGQSISFTATVAAAPPGAGTPTGGVIFEINGAPFGPTGTLVNGSATSAALSDLTPGTYLATALYSGDTNFLPSNGSAGQIVNPASTSTNLAVSPSQPVLGQPVTLTATVTPTGAGTGTPTGSIHFYDGQTLIGSVPLNAQDVATLGGLLPSTGAHAYSAVYPGEYDYAGSTSNTATTTVGGIATTTTVASSANPSQFGAAVTFTATVAPASNAGPGPAGTVTFTDGSTTLGSGALSTSGGTYRASFTVSDLAVGSHAITASYAGDADYLGSASSALSQAVGRATTSIAAKPATSGGSMTAVLSSAEGPISGQTLSFATGSTPLCTAVTNAAGSATCTAGSLKNVTLHINGSYTVTYGGNTDYLGSTGTGKA
jgi:hypothetical protein